MHRFNFQDLQFQSQWRSCYQIEVTSPRHLWNWMTKSWLALLTSLYHFQSFQRGHFTIWLFTRVQILLSIPVRILLILKYVYIFIWKRTKKGLKLSRGKDETYSFAFSVTLKISAIRYPNVIGNVKKVNNKLVIQYLNKSKQSILETSSRSSIFIMLKRQPGTQMSPKTKAMKSSQL